MLLVINFEDRSTFNLGNGCDLDHCDENNAFKFTFLLSIAGNFQEIYL